MKAFQYASARSVASAQQLAADNGRFLGGGVDLLGEMKDYIAEPRVVVNVKTISGLDRIERGADKWTLGANVTVAQIESDAKLAKVFPGLQQAAAEVGSQQIRNVATLGGNLAQHSRCWYYRHRDVQCLKRHGDMCFARHGEHKYHALFTGNTCISPVVSNLAVALATLDAVVVIEREGKSLRWTIAELYAKAWENEFAHNSLDPMDLITHVEIPTTRQRSAYVQVSEKHAFDWALVSCAAAANVSAGTLSQARVALGQISPVPHQVEAANEFLEGKTLDETVASQAADLILKGAQPLAQNAYKVPIARALIRRALLQLKV